MALGLAFAVACRLCLSADPSADDGIDPGRDFDVHRWTTADGLPDNCVFAVVQAPDGFLWLGTRLGLVRFDGVRMVTFTRGNSPGMRESRIPSLTVGGDGALWITGEQQVWVGDGSRWAPAEFAGQQVYFYHPPRPAPNGDVWVHVSNHGWARFGQRTRAEQLPSPDRDTAFVHEAATGERWLVFPGRLVRVAPRTGERSEFALPTIVNGATLDAVFAERSGGGLWMLYGDSQRSSDFRLFELTSTGPRQEGGSFQGNSPGYNSLTPDRAGTLWLSEGEGLLRRTGPGRFVRYRLPTQQRDDHPLDLIEDREGNLWLATQRSGLFRLRPRQVRTVDTDGRLPDEHVRSLLEAPSGDLVAGTEKGLAILKSRAEEPWTMSEIGLSGSSVRALAASADGTLWAGTQQGLFVRRPGAGAFLPFPLPSVRDDSDLQGVGGRKMRSLWVTKAGDLWVASAHLLAVVPRGTESARVAGLFWGKALSSVTEDQAGNVWVTTDGQGVLVLPSATLGPETLAGLPADDSFEGPGHAYRRLFLPGSISMTTTNGLPSDHAWEVYPGRDGAIWVATEAGLGRLPPASVRNLEKHFSSKGSGDKPAFFRFSEDHGMPASPVNTLIEDDLGYLWLGTDEGIYCARSEDLAGVAEGRLAHVACLRFDESDGMLAAETSGRISHPTTARGPDGRLWFATRRGIVAIDPGSVVGRGVPPLAAIEEVRADEETVFSRDPVGVARPAGIQPPAAKTNGRAEDQGKMRNGRLRLPPGRARVMEFRFAGLALAAPEKARFRYQLEGYEHTWHDVGTRRVAYYTNLDPGDYRFRVLTANHRNTWSEAPAEFGFSLAPFFWQTWWFRIGASLGVMAGTGVFVRRRIARVRTMERLRRRAEQAELRARMARDLHDGVGSGLARLTLLAERAGRELDEAGAGSPTVRQLTESTAEVARTVREIMWNASPADTSLDGLAAQMAQSTHDFLAAAGIRCRLELPDEFPALRVPPDPRSSLFFALKEAVGNAARHAAASEARLRMQVVEGRLEIQLTDNGRGFEVPNVPNGTSAAGDGAADPPTLRGNGLRNLRARIHALGGTLTITSEPGNGTGVRMAVPLRNLEDREE